MTKLLLSLFLSCSLFAFGMDFRNVDRKVTQYPHFKSLEHLSIRIKNDFEKDEDRVRAAFFWITQNLEYGRSYGMIFEAKKHYPYYSVFGRNYQLRQLEKEKIDRSFRERIGVCLDYSLILKELCNYFRLPSEIIVGVAKTEIKDLDGKSMMKNHTWNAVKIDGEWKLMDPTWASGQMKMGGYIPLQRYRDHFFFTDPHDLIKSHLPADPRWQLLENEVEASDFASGPNFYPAYFDQGVSLAPGTSGIVNIAQYNELLLYFEALPQYQDLHYAFNGSFKLKRLNVKQDASDNYVSVLKLKKRLKASQNYLTVFMDYRPILKFRIVQQ